MKRMLDFDPLTRESVWMDYDDTDDSVRIIHEQDVVPILERNKAMANDCDFTKRGIRESWWKYASIPNTLIIKWKNELGINVFDKNHEKAVFKLLNSPEYQFLRTTHKKHGV